MVHITVLVDELNTRQQCAAIAKQASSTIGCARQRIASRSRDMRSLSFY